MARQHDLGLTSSEWNALSAAARHIEDAYRMASTGALGSIDLDVRKMMAAARPIETDLGIERMVREQLQAYRDVTRFDAGLSSSWANALSSKIDIALDFPRLDRALTELADRLSAVSEQVTALEEDTSIGRKMGRDLEALTERWQTALGAQLGQIGAGFQALVTEATRGFDFGELLADIASPSSALTAIRDAISHLRDFAPDALSVAASGDVEIDGEAVEIESLRADLTEAGLRAASAPEGQRFEVWMRSLLLAAQRNPAVALLLHMVLTILLSIAANLLTPAVEHAILPKPRVVQREVNRAAQHLSAQPAALTRLRIVLEPDLPVYNRRARRSGRIDTLRYGQIVTAIERRRNWTRVEWIDDGNVMQGWVFSRYLGRIQPEKVRPRKSTLPPELDCD